MAGEAEAVRALTLLVAVCEQAMIALEALDPPADDVLAEQVERVRDLCIHDLSSERLGRRSSR